jgi:glycosyltransferase involved in cell wall biosynthesis
MIRESKHLPLRLAVGVATVGRSELARAAVDHLRRQTRAPDLVLVAASDPTDVTGVAGDGVTCIFAPRGLTKQRNAILRQASSFDVVAFFDDDFLPLSTYLEKLEEIFVAYQDVVMVTGHAIADGIIGPGFNIEEARRHLEADGGSQPEQEALVEVYNGYGCNMAVRMRAVHEGHIDFDERLPLYGWLEDVDFSRQLARCGRIVRSRAVRGVHMGVKSGRQPGIRLGYSQIANPVYLVRKGTCTWSRAIWQMTRNIAMNLIFSVRPENYIDRRGRLLGNIKAIGDLSRGQLQPERILAM